MPDTDTTARLAAALAEVQAHLPEVRKTKKATVKGTSKDGGRVEFSYTYADLADISAVLMPLLGGAGLAFSARPTLQDGQFILSYSLLHCSGERLDGAYPLPSPDRASATQIGSAITYARRYALSAICGIAAEEDDDGRAAETSPPRAASRPERPDRLGPPPERPAASLPRNSDGSISRSQATDPELAAAGNMTAGQVKDHGALRNGTVAGRAPNGKVTRAAAGPDPDDPWLEGLPAEHPLRVPQVHRPAHPPRATGGQVGIICSHFGRLGFSDDDRPQRLAATAQLAGIEHDLDSTRSLSQDQAHKVTSALSKCRDRDALLALLVAGDPAPAREVPPAPA
jgi:hypothetical protein